jgi:hypothetical protein
MNCIQCLDPCTGDSVIKFECDDTHVFHVSCLAHPPNATEAKQCPMCFSRAMERKRRAMKKDLELYFLYQGLQLNGGDKPKFIEEYTKKVKEYEAFADSYPVFCRGSAYKVRPSE